MERYTMTFPQQEHKAIAERLNQGMICYTTRVFKELDRYKEGAEYNTPWNDVIVVLEVKRFDKIAEHPFYDELTGEQIEEIAMYSEKLGKPIELISFQLSKQ